MILCDRQRNAIAVSAVVALVFAVAIPAGAVPARQHTVELSQPDGTTVAAVSFGDENENGYETPDGYVIVKDDEGVWRYAETSPQGDIVPSRVRAEDRPPKGLPKHLRSAAQRDNFVSRSVERSPSVARSTPNLGTRPVLVLLVSFDDQAPQTSTASWEAAFFGPSDSVSDYYAAASHGNLSIQPGAETHGTPNDGIVGWLDLGIDHPNTAGSTSEINHDLTRSAILAADPHVEFSAFDTNNDDIVDLGELSVVVVAAGNDTSFAGVSASCSPSVWAHQSGVFTNPPTVDGVEVAGWGSGGGYTQFGEMHCGGAFNHQATIGVMAHEIGHDLGWPDLYDVDGSSAGVGEWSIMGHGAWLTEGGVFGFFGDTPSLPDAFSRVYQGWVEPTVVLPGAGDTTEIFAATHAPEVFQFLANESGVDWEFGQSSGAGEYFLVELRTNSGYDAALPGCGLLAWHIDESVTSSNFANADDDRRLVDLEEADGQDDLDFFNNLGDAGDPFSSEEMFGPNTTPGSSLHSGAFTGVEFTNTGGCGNFGEITYSIAAPAVAETACDFNGDNFGDLAIGVPLEDLDSNQVADAGGVNVSMGSGSGLDLSTSVLIHQGTSGVPGINEVGDQFGVALACDDFNADGYADLAVGSNTEDIGSIRDAGAVTVMYGSATGLDTSTSHSFHQDTTGIKGLAESGDGFGESLATGDFDGDGYADLIVGIPGEDVGSVRDAGSIQIIFGSGSGLTTSDLQIDQNAANTALSANQDDLFGASLATGDFNGDGYADVAVGVPLADVSGHSDAGLVHIYLGAASGFSDYVIHQGTPQTPGSNEAGDVFGWSLAAGDFDGDGNSDLAVGAPGEDIGSVGNAGAVVWNLGGSGHLGVDGAGFISQDSAGVKGMAETQDLFGWSVAVGPTTGGPYDQLLVGIPGENFDRGALAAFASDATGVRSFDQLWSQNSGGIAGTGEPGDLFGASIALSDLDGDGNMDAVIGVHGEAIGSAGQAGAVNILRGGGLALTEVGDRFVSQDSAGVPGSAESGDFFGYSGAGATGPVSSASQRPN